MDNIETIPKARIPIVKFKDPRSGLDVDISWTIDLQYTTLKC